MALPPKHDPRRPLYLAIRSVRLLGICFIVIGALAGLPYTISGRMVGPTQVLLVELLERVLFFAFPGSVSILAGIYLKKRKKWALVTTLLLTAVLCFLSLFAATVMLAILTVSFDEWRVIMPLMIFTAMGLALGQLVYYLAKSFEAIRYTPLEMQERGFEPVLVARMNAPQAGLLNGGSIQAHSAEVSEADGE